MKSITLFMAMAFVIAIMGAAKPAYANKMDGKPGGDTSSARYGQSKKPPAKKPIAKPQ